VVGATVVGAGLGTTVVVPGFVLVVVVFAVLVLFAELTTYDPADSVKSDENADQSTGFFGRGQSTSPSFAVTVRMKSPQICAGNVPPATVMPCTLVIERRTPSSFG